VCRDPVGITEVVKTFQGFREEKLRRKSAFVHKRNNCKECRKSGKPFKVSQVLKAQDGQDL
jgi:hypothetical protein